MGFLTMKGAFTHQIHVQGRLASHLSASVIPSRWFSHLEDLVGLPSCHLAVSCNTSFTGGFC